MRCYTGRWGTERRDEMVERERVKKSPRYILSKELRVGIEIDMRGTRTRSLTKKRGLPTNCPQTSCYSTVWKGEE
jgi:hypothetical protein